MESVIRPMRVYQMQDGVKTLVETVSAEDVRLHIRNQALNGVGFNGRKKPGRPPKNRVSATIRKPKDKKPKVFTRTCAHCGREFEQTTGRKASWCHECRKLPYAARKGDKRE